MDLLYKTLGLTGFDGAELLDESLKEEVSKKNSSDDILEEDISAGLELLGKTFKSGMTDGRDLIDQLIKPDITDRKDLFDETLELDIIEGIGLVLKTHFSKNETDLLDEIKDD